MNVILGDEAERLIRQKIASGAYSSAEDVLLAGLEALRLNENAYAPGELDALISEGEASLTGRDPIAGEQVFQQVRELSRSHRDDR